MTTQHCTLIRVASTRSLSLIRKVLLNIVNFSKTKSLYREGLSPVVRSRRRPQWNVRWRSLRRFPRLVFLRQTYERKRDAKQNAGMVIHCQPSLSLCRLHGRPCLAPSKLLGWNSKPAPEVITLIEVPHRDAAVASRPTIDCVRPRACKQRDIIRNIDTEYDGWCSRVCLSAEDSLQPGAVLSIAEGTQEQNGIRHVFSVSIRRSQRRPLLLRLRLPVYLYGLAEISL